MRRALCDASRPESLNYLKDNIVIKPLALAMSVVGALISTQALA